MPGPDLGCGTAQRGPVVHDPRGAREIRGQPHVQCRCGCASRSGVARRRRRIRQRNLEEADPGLRIRRKRIDRRPFAERLEDQTDRAEVDRSNRAPQATERLRRPYNHPNMNLMSSRFAPLAAAVFLTGTAISAAATPSTVTNADRQSTRDTYSDDEVAKT